jgi:hypothetical protein
MLIIENKQAENFMNLNKSFIKNEILTARLNDILARYAEYIKENPDSCMIASLKIFNKDLAIAHRKSRVYPNKKRWIELLNNAEKLLEKARELDEVERAYKLLGI